MAIPDFIVSLREKIGHETLWLAGVTAVVEHEGRLLMVKRSDSGAWTPVTGIIDPGEEPAIAAAREVLEEAGVVAVAERLAWVHVLPPMAYPNGDRAQYLDLVFRMRWVSGTPYPADGENTEAEWFAMDALPPHSNGFAQRIAHALSDDVATGFEA
ncbi:MAG: ADP-ribose pyrophosphatase [Subtercola sp.]|nr:ADP-ribose pyrophosphatase [Subtercola sp.]